MAGDELRRIRYQGGPLEGYAIVITLHSGNRYMNPDGAEVAHDDLLDDGTFYEHVTLDDGEAVMRYAPPLTEAKASDSSAPSAGG